YRFLEDALGAALERAQAARIALALVPEPGHLPATLESWKRVSARVPVLLALDVTHLSVEAEEPAPAEAVRAFAGDLALVHVADSPRGVHDHRLLGEGDLDLVALLRSLREIEFRGLISVELSRHSHAAHEVVPATIARLREAARSS
ncbi:sugar phosphate isomerase/epimerase, partial [bacterium]|nr:sugar phosphate isomerase/epimerase [bacterium]